MCLGFSLSAFSVWWTHVTWTKDTREKLCSNEHPPSIHNILCWENLLSVKTIFFFFPELFQHNSFNSFHQRVVTAMLLSEFLGSSKVVVIHAVMMLFAYLAIMPIGGMIARNRVLSPVRRRNSDVSMRFCCGRTCFWLPQFVCFLFFQCFLYERWWSVGLKSCVSHSFKRTRPYFAPSLSALQRWWFEAHIGVQVSLECTVWTVLSTSLNPHRLLSCLFFFPASWFWHCTARFPADSGTHQPVHQLALHDGLSSVLWSAVDRVRCAAAGAGRRHSIATRSHHLVGTTNS